jgi:L-lactate dehydrogenase complex protein LldG
MIGGENVERDVFLARVTAALRGAELPTVDGPGRAPTISYEDPLGRFVAEATAVAADVVRVSSDGVFDAIAAVLVAADVTQFIAWDGLGEVVSGWDEWVVRAGYERVDAAVRAEHRREDLARVGSVKIGITSADVGIAASGSVVLAHGRGRPRSASLLVETHIVLLPAKRIVSSLGKALGVVSCDGTSNIAVITGPSRTGDIESVLTLGVHGPRHLHIIVIE